MSALEKFEALDRQNVAAKRKAIDNGTDEAIITDFAGNTSRHSGGSQLCKKQISARRIT